MITYLITDKKGIYVDATVGSGGHTEVILRECGEDAMVVGIDRDPDAIERVRARIKDKRLRLLKGRFSEMKELLQSISITEVDGVLMDLGVSLEQLKTPERGFSFDSDAPLDMRMEKSGTLTAEKIINTWSQRQLEYIFRNYGEEKKARLIAREIVRQRARTPITTCKSLSILVQRLYGHRGRRHPATKVFQALRIAVNDEINELQKGLIAAFELLKKGGRLCVISYHSIEDRVVKRFFAEKSRAGQMAKLTKKPVIPSPEEIRENPSSRSAKLRAGEKV